MNTELFNVFVDGVFAGTAVSLTEAQAVAKQFANRTGKVGSVNYLITDNKNNRRGGGSLYSV
jgi:hypothetical protein